MTFCFQCMNDSQGKQPCPHCGAFEEPNPAGCLPQGTSLKNGNYIIGRVLGRGGYGITYLGIQHSELASVRVAIKEFYPAFGAQRRDDSQSIISQGRTLFSESTHKTVDAFAYGLKSFEEECQYVHRILGEEGNRHIVPTMDTFKENGTAYLVMRYVEGRSLQEEIRPDAQQPPVPWELEKTLKVLLPVLKTVDRLHKKQGLLHRDIKPANILIRNEDQSAVLIDFGCACRIDKEESDYRAMETLPGVSPGYSPLERYAWQKGTPASDVYSCGATLYFCLSGISPDEATRRAAGETLRPLHEAVKGIPKAISLAIMKSLALNVNERWKSVDEFIRALSGKEVKPQPKRGLGMLIALLACIAIGLAGFLAYLVFVPAQEEIRAKEAMAQAAEAREAAKARFVREQCDPAIDKQFQTGEAAYANGLKTWDQRSYLSALDAFGAAKSAFDAANPSGQQDVRTAQQTAEAAQQKSVARFEGIGDPKSDPEYAEGMTAFARGVAERDKQAFAAATAAFQAAAELFLKADPVRSHREAAQKAKAEAVAAIQNMVLPENTDADSKALAGSIPPNPEIKTVFEEGDAALLAAESQAAQEAFRDAAAAFVKARESFAGVAGKSAQEIAAVNEIIAAYQAAAAEEKAVHERFAGKPGEIAVNKEYQEAAAAVAEGKSQAQVRQFAVTKEKFASAKEMYAKATPARQITPPVPEPPAPGASEKPTKPVSPPPPSDLKKKCEEAKKQAETKMNEVFQRMAEAHIMAANCSSYGEAGKKYKEGNDIYEEGIQGKGQKDKLENAIIAFNDAKGFAEKAERECLHGESGGGRQANGISAETDLRQQALHAQSASNIEKSNAENRFNSQRINVRRSKEYRDGLVLWNQAGKDLRNKNFSDAISNFDAAKTLFAKADPGNLVAEDLVRGIMQGVVRNIQK